jgi:hypothetical protein
MEIGGPLTKWADFHASGSGQWASQTEPLATPRTDQRSRLLFGNARGRVRAGGRDQSDALYSGSRIDLSDGGVPAGLEALTGNRMAPSFILPGGFPGKPETDHLDSLQVGWTHLLPAGTIHSRFNGATLCQGAFERTVGAIDRRGKASQTILEGFLFPRTQN